MTAAAPITLVPRGLFARAVGIFFSPRATYADIALRPRPMPALLLVLAVMALVNFAFLSTEIGQRAWMDQALTQLESFGRPVTPEIVETMERRRSSAPIIAAAAVLIVSPVAMAVLATALMVAFNAVMGTDARFGQVFSVVAHAGFIGALQQLFVAPLNYARETLTSATSVAAFAPMIDSSSWFGMVLGSIDFFRIWSLVTISIGLAVLYKRRTAPIAWSLLGAALLIVLVVSLVKAVFSGA